MIDIKIKRKAIGLEAISEICICLFYAWYCLPVLGALLSNSIFKVVFLALLALGTAGLILHNSGKLRINGVVITILLYFSIFIFLFLFDVDQASAHIRVSFIFWVTGILYFGILNDKQKVKIGSFLIAVILLTIITSAIGVIRNNDAARSLTFTLTDDAIQTKYKLQNISSIYLFQCLVFFIPIIVCLGGKANRKVLSFLLVGAIIFILLHASFMIALLVSMVALIASLRFVKFKKSTVLFVMLLSVVIGSVIYRGNEVLSWLSQTIPNQKISLRILGIRDVLYYGEENQIVSGRFDLYKVSLETFFHNPFGVGAFYAYKTYDHGIGYHSQLLDDLARYGIGAILFYTSFFVGYYRYLKQEWGNIGYSNMAGIMVLLYLIFLILNLGFRSAEESVVMLFIIPVIPKIINAKAHKTFEKKLDCN